RPRLEGPNPTPTRSWTMMGSWSLRDTLVPSGWGSALVGRRTDTSVSGGDRGRPERAEGLFGGEDGAAPSGRVTQGRAVLLGAEVGQRVGDHERLDVPHERVGGGELAADVGVDAGDDDLVAPLGGHAFGQVGLGERAVAPLGEQQVVL